MIKPTDDPVINNVVDRIIQRHLQGMKKFQVTMAENSKPIELWIEDIIEELIDAICYMVTLKSRFEKTINDFKYKVRVAETELSLIKGINHQSEKSKEIEELKKEIDMLRDDLQIVNLENGRMMEKINKLGHNGKQKT